MRPYYQDDAVTIYHGDCREFAIEADAVVSDPPYGMRVDTNSTRFTGGHRVGGPPVQGRSDWGAVAGDAEPFDPTPWLRFPKVVLWGFNHFSARLPVGTTLVWIKRFDAAFGSFLSDAEVAWMKGGHGVYCRRDTSLAGDTLNRRHPTEKPLGVMRWCIEKTGGAMMILDPYMGSGTTLRAAKDLGRKAIGIEIEERYCEIAAKRCAQEVLDIGTAA